MAPYTGKGLPLQEFTDDVVRIVADLQAVRARALDEKSTAQMRIEVEEATKRAAAEIMQAVDKEMVRTWDTLPQPSQSNHE